MSEVAESKVAEAVHRYLAAWNEQNPGRRRVSSPTRGPRKGTMSIRIGAGTVTKPSTR
jgi:hypothetical protein